MQIIVLKSDKTRRVPLIPTDAEKLIKHGYSILCESGVGYDALFCDDDYIAKGCSILDNTNENDLIEKFVSNNIDNFFIFCVYFDDLVAKKVQNFAKNTSIRVCVISTNVTCENLPKLNITLFNLDNLPRITRAQSMDVLSSQNNIAGYLAIIESARLAQKIFPMMTTAAGSIKPAKILVIGAGVAGLQAIATAKRLGANVWACDVRAESKEEVESLGAKFVQIPVVKSTGGYVTELSDERIEEQKTILREHIISANAVICTALIRGKKAPIVVTLDMITSMKKGAVIIDLAVSSGGNCDLSQNKITEHKGVIIAGYDMIVENNPHEPSIVLSKNYVNFLMYIKEFFNKENFIDSTIDDEIISCTMKKIHY